MYEKNNLYITSNDFASFANIIYSDRQMFVKQLFNGDSEIIEYSKDEQFKHITYKELFFEITSGDIIFCNTNQVDNLFYHLKKLSKVEDLILITHQTDKLITQKDFDKKPTCIKEWLTVNAGFINPNLHAIPIGVASNFSLKNLISTDFLDFKTVNYKKNHVSLYINYQENTNYGERRDIAKTLAGKNWVNFDKPNLVKYEYMNRLANSSFVLCPWGNGIDTHRLWETLYLGSIPVTKYHPTFNYNDQLPILFVDEYSDINYDLLSDYLKNFQLENYNFDILTKNYWKEYLKDIKSDGSNSVIIREKWYITLYFKSKRKILNKLSSRRKKNMTFYYKIIKRLGL